MPSTSAPHILLVNPWIHDFAAHDFWAKPLGLLNLASILRLHGFMVSFIDCTDRFHPNSGDKDPRDKYGCGNYIKTRIQKPRELDDIPRYFSRYGMPIEWFIGDLKSIPKPDVILVTSLMTYWYTGVFETIAQIKSVYPDVPVILGGIYATLYEEHARRYSNADEIVSGPADHLILELMAKYTGFRAEPRFDPNQLDSYPFASLDLYRRIGSVPILTSKGCPFSCTYCASNILAPDRMVRSPESVIEEIVYWHRQHHVIDFSFYDDALLVDAPNHIHPILDGIIDRGLKLRFHTPNAVHLRNISLKTAQLLVKAGFTTLRLGLETTDFENRKNLDAKVTRNEFLKAAAYLKEAGFKRQNVGAYLLVGLPFQSEEAIIESIRVVKEANITPIAAYYSPIPKTQLWTKAIKASRYDLEEDPIFTNNSIFPCRKEPFSWAIITRLKTLIKQE